MMKLLTIEEITAIETTAQDTGLSIQMVTNLIDEDKDNDINELETIEDIIRIIGVKGVKKAITDNNSFYNAIKPKIAPLLTSANFDHYADFSWALTQKWDIKLQGVIFQLQHYVDLEAIIKLHIQLTDYQK